MKPTSIEQSAHGYSRGVIFGLTMAEVFLLMVFCLLLFSATLQKKIDELKIANANVEQTLLALEKRVLEISQKNEILEVSNENYKENLTELDQSTSVSQELFDVVNTLDDSELQKLIENTEIASAYSFEQMTQLISKADDWDVLTNQPPKPTFEKLDEIEKNATIEELNRLIQNADTAMKTNPEILAEQISKAEKWDKQSSLPAVEQIDPYIKSLVSQVSLKQLELLAAGQLEPAGNKWPPIISLPEAENYSFKIGSAQLTQNFKTQLEGKIVEEILQTLSKYEADLIEVIGHTDLQPMSRARVSNLDTSAKEFFETDKEIALRAKDNVGLGYARALSVTKHLLRTPELQGYTILPYSAAQMITPNGTIAKIGDDFESSQLRRIEIRVRRQNK